ncbi:MAG: flagellar basal body P-ring protein FlgI [Planctomycetaceae bacterium]|nr:flagellar basal body P-ring protein FlgI [Planctomycetaceae bacterium]
METRKVYAIVLIGMLLWIGGCEESRKKGKGKDVNDVNEPTKLDRTIGDLAEIVANNTVPVKGVGLVIGLSGTGSSECPAATREYLRKYIVTQVGRQDTVKPDSMINSIDTAVVIVEGTIPPAASRYQHFDITVKPYPDTQTTSLVGGRLYTTELKFIAKVDNSLEASRTLAYAAGPIYIDSMADSKTSPMSGVVLGGGRVIDDYSVTLSLIKPDYKAAAYIRNRINQRFGKDVANAVSDRIINVSVPANYKDKKSKFIMLINSLYIASGAANEEIHINQLIEELKQSPDKTKFQIALEAIGRPAAEELYSLIDANDEKTRFSAAAASLAIGDSRGLKPLRDFAQDPCSSLRILAINNVGEYGYKNDVISLMNRLSGDDHFDVKFAAYTYLWKFSAPSVIRTIVSEDFFVDQVIATGPKAIYAYRKQQAGFVFFGAPINCETDIYIESEDGGIIINSPPTDDRISILRKHPITGGLMGPLKCSTRIADIVKLLGDPPTPKNDKARPGLGVPYSEIVQLLKTMSAKGAVKAEFIAGPAE